MISNVIITCNRIELLKKTFNNTISNVVKHGGEIIIVDNGSDDGTREFLLEKNKKFNFINIIVNNKNLGIAPARNLGLKKAKYDVIICMDDDMLIDEDNYLKCKKVFIKHKNAGVIAPLCIDHEKDKHLNNKLNLLEPYKVSNHHGSFGIFYKEAIIKANYLDEKCFYGAEERSLCMKVHINGYEIIFDPSIVGLHIDTIDRKKPNIFRVKMRVYNNVRLNFKYLPYYYAFKYSLRILLSYLSYSMWSFGLHNKKIILEYFFKGIYDGIKHKFNTPNSTIKYYTNPKLTPYFGNNNFFK